MIKKSIISKLLIYSFVLILLLSGCSGRKYEIKLNNQNWRSIEASTSISKFIIENGYGYPVKVIETPIARLRDTLNNGEIDIITEVWLQNMGDLFQKDLEDGTIISLGNVVEDAQQFWMIPKWVAEEYEIRTVLDIGKHWKLFTNSENPGKGIFYGGVEGWSFCQINIVKIKTYGLDKYYDIVFVRNPETFNHFFINAQEKKQPIFGYYWAPTALMGLYDWYVLKEPEYNDTVWKKIQKEIDKEKPDAIDQVCSNKIFPLIKVVRSDFVKKAPEVVEMLKKMSFSLSDLNNIVAWMQQNNVEDSDSIARYYLANYEDIWKTWVTPEAYKKIRRSLGNVIEK